MKKKSWIYILLFLIALKTINAATIVIPSPNPNFNQNWPETAKSGLQFYQNATGYTIYKAGWASLSDATRCYLYNGSMETLYVNTTITDNYCTLSFAGAEMGKTYLILADKNGATYDRYTTTGMAGLWPVANSSYLQWMHNWISGAIDDTQMNMLVNLTITTGQITQGMPTLNSSDKWNRSSHNLNCKNTSTTDSDANTVWNTYSWLGNGTPLQVLSMPFNSNNSADSIVNDYSGLNHTGTANGAIWGATTGVNGSGGYSFDGKNDYIQLTIPEDIKTISYWHKNSTDNSWTFTINSSGEVYTFGTTYAYPFYRTGNTLQIGNSTSGYYNGTIDQVLLFNRTLNTTEIYMLYHDGAYGHQRFSWTSLTENWTYRCMAAAESATGNTSLEMSNPLYIVHYHPTNMSETPTYNQLYTNETAIFNITMSNFNLDTYQIYIYNEDKSLICNDTGTEEYESFICDYVYSETDGERKWYYTIFHDEGTINSSLMMFRISVTEYNYLYLNFSTKVNAIVQHQDGLIYFTNVTTINLSEGEVPDGRTIIRFMSGEKSPNETDFYRQYYEYDAEGQTESASLYVLPYTDGNYWMLVVDKSTNPQKDIPVNLYIANTSGLNSTYNYIGRKITDANGYVWFYIMLGTAYYYKSIVEADVLSWDTFPQLSSLFYTNESNTQASPLKTVISQNSSWFDWVFSYYVPPYFYNRTKEITCKVYYKPFSTIRYRTIKNGLYTQYRYATSNYNYLLSTINFISLLTNEYYFTLYPATNFQTTGTENITIEICEGEPECPTLLGNITITYVENPWEGSLEIQQYIDSTEYKDFILFFALLIVTIAVQFFFQNPQQSMGKHVFLWGTVILMAFSFSLWLPAFISLIHYMMQSFRKMLQQPN